MTNDVFESGTPPSRLPGTVTPAHTRPLTANSRSGAIHHVLADPRVSGRWLVAVGKGSGGGGGPAADLANLSDVGFRYLDTDPIPTAGFLAGREGPTAFADRERGERVA